PLPLILRRWWRTQHAKRWRDCRSRLGKTSIREPAKYSTALRSSLTLVQNSTRVRIVRLFDTVVSGAVITLVCFTALAFGAVYPWGFKTIEVAGFVSNVICIASLAIVHEEAGDILRAILPYGI